METAVATAPAARADLRFDGVQYSENEVKELVTQLSKMRDDIVAGLHPRLKCPRPKDKGRLQLAVEGAPAPSSQPLPNGVVKTATNGGGAPAPPRHSAAAAATAAPLSKTANTNVNARPPSPAWPVASKPALSTQIDPIFLTKSDVVVRAEAQHKRARLEQALEEQVQQKDTSAKHRTFEQDALPDFDVGETLRKAQELVKPFVSRGGNGLTEGASSADSFDENTFYSSQMNESTSAEEGEEPKRARRGQMCRFFLNGQRCPYGANCIFPHELGTKDGDNRNHEEKAGKARSHYSPHPVEKDTTKAAARDDQPAPAMSQQERIAQLEAELRAMKEGRQLLSTGDTSNGPRENQESQDDSAYSPPGPDEFGRDTSLRDRNKVSSRDVQRSSGPDASNHTQSQRYDYGRVVSQYSPPPSNNMRVVRNQITSPFAPQPARLSPFAVAKVSQVSQGFQDHQNQNQNQNRSRQPSRGRNFTNTSAGPSPNMHGSAANSRKRRRGPDPDDLSRNVAPRRDISPEIRIKQEPMSPDPFNGPHPRRPPLAQDSTQLYAPESRGPPFQPQERVIYQGHTPQRPVEVYEVEDRPRPSPVTARTVSRNGQYLVSHGEPDLRRVVSQRQMKAPPLPPTYRLEDDSDPGPRLIRASSHAYPPQTEYVRRSSVQPQAESLSSHGRSPAPARREQPLSPTATGPVAMGPPQRILVDQYGNQFIEPDERQIPMAPPTRHPQIEPSYERQVRIPRSMSVRPASQAEHEYSGAAVQHHRPVSPASPQYVTHLTQPRTAFREEGDSHRDYAYEPQGIRQRVIYREAPRQAPVYEDNGGSAGRFVRVQSVRPGDDRYDFQDVSRAASVRPQPQPRIIQLSEGRAQSPQVSSQVIRQTSLRPQRDFSSSGGVRYIEDDRPVYQYTRPVAERGYVTEINNERVYDAPQRPG